MNQRDIFLIINKYKAKRPSAKRNLDQFWATNKTVFKRAQFLNKIDDIKNKKIIFLGDDDLTSIYFCLTGRAKEVLVIDIDKRIIHYIQEVSEKENLKIKTKVWDLRNPLPKEFKDYDIAFFDPAYTPQGVTTWLKSCIEATLRSGKLNKKRKSPDVLTKKRYYLCYGYSDRSSERGLEIQKIITNFGLIIQEKIKGFNKYIGAQSIGSKSDLYILMPTPKVNIAKSDKITTKFYTGHKSQN